MKTESDGEWLWQLSIKLGRNNQQMLNIRAKSWEEFKNALAQIQEEPETVQEAASAFDTETATQLPLADVRAVPPPVAQTAPVATVNTQQGEEIGPITVTSYSPESGVSGPKSKRPGTPYTRHNVIFGNGAIKASTFDSLVAQVAQSLLGKPAFVRVNKTQYGYDLLNVRPAQAA